MNKRRISPSIKTLNGLVEKKLLQKDREKPLPTNRANNEGCASSKSSAGQLLLAVL